jgi:glutamate decarboxylase
VRSINVSNHKYGLVYPGMGTVVFRESDDVPEELVFHINYLGGDMPNYSLNFSRPSSSVILQYFAFLRLGIEGYREIVGAILENSRSLAAKLAKIEGIQPITDASQFPILALRATEREELDLKTISHKLRERGWIVPAYTLPANAEQVEVLRIVVKENFSRDMAELFTADMRSAVSACRAGTTAHSHRQRKRPIC